MKNQEKHQQICTWTTTKTAQKLKIAAALETRTQRQIINNALTDYLNTHHPNL